jgi:hypothetical protein
MSVNFLLGTPQRRSVLGTRFVEDLNPLGGLNPFRQPYRNAEDTCYKVRTTVNLALTALALYGAHLAYVAVINHPVSAAALATGVAYTSYKVSQKGGDNDKTFTVCVNGVDMKFPLLIRDEVLRIIHNSNEKDVQGDVDAATEKIKAELLKRVESVNIRVGTLKGGKKYKRKTMRR